MVFPGSLLRERRLQRIPSCPATRAPPPGSSSAAAPCACSSRRQPALNASEADSGLTAPTGVSKE